MKFLRILAIPLALSLSLVACSKDDSPSTDAPSETTVAAVAGDTTVAADDTSGRTYAIVSDAEADAGLTKLAALVDAAAAAVEAKDAGALDAVTAVYNHWYTFEGTIRAKDENRYLDFEDALTLLQAAENSGDPAKAKEAVTTLADLIAAYRAGTPAATSAPTSSLPPSDVKVPVTLSLAGCESYGDVAAGPVSFEVENTLGDGAEFELLTAEPKIVAEEFLDAGTTKVFTYNLVGGDYTLICGSPQGTKGTLTVTGDAPAAAAAVLKVDPAKLAAAVAEYQTYVRTQADALLVGTTQFTDAVLAGDLEKAKSLYAATRVPWEEIEPVAELFPDSDGSIDARADDFEAKEEDPTFTGFHRIEHFLWAKNTTKGAEPFATKLKADVEALVTLVKDLPIQADVMVNGAAGLIEETAQTKITGEEERYSHTDLVTFAANVEGARKVYSLIRPLLEPVDTALATAIDADFTTVDGLLAPYKTSTGYDTYEKLTDADRAKFKGALASMSEDLAKVAGSLGLEVQ